MAEYKQVDLQIGTEAQFETKKADLPVGTIVGLTDPIHEEELDSDLQTAINSISNKLDKPSGNPTEDSLVKVSSTGSTSYQALATLVDLASEQTIVGMKTFRTGLYVGQPYTASQDGVAITTNVFSFHLASNPDIGPGHMKHAAAPLYEGYLDQIDFQFPTIAQNPATAPTADSVTVYEATTAKPTWKPLSEFASSMLSGLYQHCVKLTVGDITVYYNLTTYASEEYTQTNLPVMHDTAMTTLSVLASGYYSTVSGLIYRSSEGELKAILHGMYTTNGTSMTYLNVQGQSATFVTDDVTEL